MKQLRRTIFWCHLVIGLMAGLIILIMSVTGLLLTYERQIIAAANKRACRIEPGPESRLPIETLFKSLSQTQTATPSAVILRSDPYFPVEFSFGRDRSLFVNPYTGAVLGEGASNVRQFFHVVRDWHRWLGAHDNRAIARAITGACNLAFLFILISGVYLWWPRKWRPNSLRNITWFRGDLSGRARDFNWHNTFGFWSALPLIVIVFSALFISYSWAGNLVYKMFGEKPPAPTERRERRAAQPENLNPLWEKAERHVPGWKIITLRLPEKSDGAVTFNIDTGNGGQPQLRSQLTLSGEGKILKWEPFYEQSPGRRLRSYLRFAHTGEVAGVIGQTIAGLASTGAIFLIFTGFSLAFRRFRMWTARRKIVVGSEKGTGLPALSDSH
jgi:uncharacterized iron-regulated membrane protein